MSREIPQFDPSKDTIHGEGFVARPGSQLAKRAEGAIGLEFRPDNSEPEDNLNNKSSKEKIDTAPVITYNPKNLGTSLKGKITEAYRDAKDKVAALKVDYDSARKDEKFEKFLGDIGEKLDWNKDIKEIKEAYVLYERSNKVTENYQNLFEGKLKNIVGNDTEAKSEIAAHILELAKTEPDKLRKLEKEIEAVLKSEKEIGLKQNEINKYKSKGGKEGLQDKIDTLKQAKSIGRILAQHTWAHKLFGIGNKKMLAYEKAKKEYGLVDRESMVKEIKSAKSDVKNITSLENEKTKIKSKFSKERGQIYLDNETAKRVHDKIKGQIQERFGRIMTIEQIADLKNLKKYVQEVKTQFGDEGRKERTGLSKKIFKTDEFRDVDFLNMSESSFDEIDRMLDQRIEQKIEEKFSKIVKATELGKMEEEVNKYFKKSEFAGMSKKESANKVYKTFMKLKESLQQKSAEALKLSLVLSKLEYLTV